MTSGMTGLHDIVDAHATAFPHSAAVVDDNGTWSYAELKLASLHAAAVLRDAGLGEFAQPCSPVWHPGHVNAPRPLALAMPRNRTWLAICLASWRVGLPVVAVSGDMPDKSAEAKRNSRIADELRPIALVTGEDPTVVLPGAPPDCRVLEVKRFIDAISNMSCRDTPKTPSSGEFKGGADCVLAYVYTGGTTRHSKCVVVTHSMALWEMTHYASALQGRVNRNDRFLQYSSVYWGAAVFGQLDVALAFGACSVIVDAPNVEAIAEATARHNITVLGIVPSQLRGAWPGGPSSRPSCLRVLIAWADKLPVKLAQEWKAHVQIFELLIASEYWLALASDCRLYHDPVDSRNRHVLQAVPGLDMKVLAEDGSRTAVGEVGEMFLSGPTVSPGYVGPDGRVGSGPENEAAFVTYEGRRFYRTRDRLRRLPCGGFVYIGRGGALAKRGGTWIDLEAMEATACDVPGVASAVVVVSEEVADIFLVLDEPPLPKAAPETTARAEPLLRVVESAKRAIGNLEARLHIRSELPLHPATAKVDRNQLLTLLSDVQVRDAEYYKRLGTIQHRMLMGYCGWYAPIILAAMLPSILFFRIAAAAFVTISKLLLMPYLWAALLYTVLEPYHDRKFWFWPVGPPDVLLLSILFLPASTVGAVLAACSSVLSWKRDSRRCTSVAFFMLSVSLFVALARGSVSSACSIRVWLVSVLFLSPHRIEYIVGLPVSCFLVLPKWVRDDWKWRAKESFLRRTLMRVLLIWDNQPSWDASWVWEAEASKVDWGDAKKIWTNVKVSAPDTSGVTLDYWEDVVDERDLVPHKRNVQPAPSLHQSPLLVQLCRIAERAGAGNGSCGLETLDSLQAIGLAEMIRRELGREISVRDVLNCSGIDQLAAKCAAAGQLSHTGGGSEELHGREEHSDEEGSFRVYTMRFAKSPIDWCVRYKGPTPLNVEAMQRACDRVVARHSALRTVQSPDEPMREAMDKVAAMWQLWTSCFGGGRCWHIVSELVGKCLMACWPRTILQSAQAARVRLRTPQDFDGEEPENWGDEDERGMRTVKRLIKDKPKYPFEVVLVPSCPTAEDHVAENGKTAAVPDVTYYLHTAITHAYSDGSTGQALLRDLLRCYDEEVRAAPSQEEREAREHFSLLQYRLRRSLKGRLPGQEDPNNDVYHEIVCEDWGMRAGLTRRFYLAPRIQNALRFSAMRTLGCTIDVAWLTAIFGALFRLFPNMPCIRMILKTACRDGPGEREMVGFLSEQRSFVVDTGDPRTATLCEVANKITSTRRARSWRAPLPFEAGLCVYVNIVSAMIEGLPENFKHVPRVAGDPSRIYEVAYSQVNFRIDQIAADKWDFRIFHWDASWGWDWSVYFATALGAVIGDMALRPTAPLLHASHPPPSLMHQISNGTIGEAAPSGKRKVNGSTEDFIFGQVESGTESSKCSSDSSNVSRKVPRTTTND